MTTTMIATTLPPHLKVIADKVAALQRMKDESGFQTKKTIRELLSPLSTTDLTLVAEALYSR